MRHVHRLAAAVALLLAGGVMRGQIVIPDTVPVTKEDEAAIRKMLGEYVAAVRAGDRQKAMSFAHIEEKEHEKVTRLGVEIDFAIEKLRAAVQKKLGKDAWGDTGERLGEMTPDGMKDVAIKNTASVDEVKVNWSDKSKLPENKRLGSDVTIKRIKGTWKFQLVEDAAIVPEARRWLRDAIGEISDLAADVEAGKVNKEHLGKAVEKLVKELKPAEDVEPGVVPGVEVPPMPMPPVEQ